MSETGLVDITGRRRSPAATPGHWAGCAPPNKGQHYPADPPTVEEIILVMRQAGPGPYADRTRGLIAILWRAGLRITEERSRSTRPIWTQRPGRCWSAPARVGSEGWSEWTTGHGSTSGAGPSTGSSCPSVRCSASSAVPPAVADGQRRPRAASFVGSPRRLACGGGSRRIIKPTRDRAGRLNDGCADVGTSINYGTRMRSRWRTKGSSCRLSRGSSGMPTSGSRRSTSKASTHERSWTRCTTAGRR